VTTLIPSSSKSWCTTLASKVSACASCAVKNEPVEVQCNLVILMGMGNKAHDKLFADRFIERVTVTTSNGPGFMVQLDDIVTPLL
jgi:hypothetical protein